MLAAWCADWAENSGDARYCSVGRALDHIADEWDYRGGGWPATITRDLEAALAERLPDVLNADTAVDGSYHGRLLREEVDRILALGS